MKRTILIFSLLFCVAILLNARNFSFFGTYEDMAYGNISFMPNGEGSYSSNNGEIQKFEYSVNQEYEVLTLSLKNSIFTHSGEEISKLLLLNALEIDLEKQNYKIRRLTFIFDNSPKYDKESVFISDTKRNFGIYYSYSNQTSCLEEGSKIYSVNNLSSIELETPWVEGTEGNGIGESFSVDFKLKDDNYILIINGYISFEKTYLYEQNSRIKRIKVTGLQSNKSLILEVLDTPHPQTVDISFLDETEGFSVEIVDVYPGTKYEDTCIHYLAPYENQVIPYE